MAFACLFALILLGVGIYALWVRRRYWLEFQRTRPEPWQMRHRAHRGGI